MRIWLEGFTSHREDLLVLEGGDMSKGHVYVIQIESIKVRNCRCIQTLVIKEHLPHSAHWLCCEYGRCALQLADLQCRNSNGLAHQQTKLLRI